MCVRPRCGLQTLTPGYYFDDFGEVRLIHRAAYIPKITVHAGCTKAYMRWRGSILG